MKSKMKITIKRGQSSGLPETLSNVSNLRDIGAKTKRTMNPLPRTNWLAAGLLFGAMALFGGCSQNDEPIGGDDGTPIPVQFTSQVSGQAAPGAQASGSMKISSGTRSGDVEITARGTTSTGLEYIEYVAADGFLTREVMLPEMDGQKNDMLKTRTSTGADGETQWSADDEVGIFMLKTGGAFTNPADVLADNMKYLATPGSNAKTATFAPADAGQTIYYPQAGNVDFVAYYPYGGTGTNAGQVSDTYIYKVSVAAQSTPEERAKADILYSNNVTDKSRSKTEPAALEFKHALAKLVINVKAGTGMGAADFSGTTAEMSGFPTTADLSLADGKTFTNPGGTSTAITANKWTTPATGYKATLEAFVIPQSGTNAGRTVVFTVAGSTYTWTLPDATAFEGGKIHSYEIAVNEAGITVGGNTITDWTGTGVNPTPGTAEEIGKGIAKVHIPAGDFQMGSESESVEPNSYDDERPQYNVNVGEFWMSKFEITNTQYAAFLNAKSIGSDGKGEVTYDNNGTPATESQKFISAHNWGVTYNAGAWKAQDGYENHPVINVTWYGATAFAAWTKGRLPTETEWEYACRAGTTTPFGIGDGTKLYSDMANINGSYPYELPGGNINNFSGSAEHPNTYLANTCAVGSYPYRNAWGLYDMHGNVSEWTSSYWTDSYSEADRQNPNTAYRVLRGGFWSYFAQGCRSAFRGTDDPAYAYDNVGFRVVFVP